jgi:hypothetical protein
MSQILQNKLCIKALCLYLILNCSAGYANKALENAVETFDVKKVAEIIKSNRLSLQELQKAHAVARKYCEEDKTLKGKLDRIMRSSLSKVLMGGVLLKLVKDIMEANSRLLRRINWNSKCDQHIKDKHTNASSNHDTRHCGYQKHNLYLSALTLYGRPIIDNSFRLATGAVFLYAFLPSVTCAHEIVKLLEDAIQEKKAIKGYY